MDRQTIYAGQVPLETDLLKTQQNTMVAVAQMLQTILGQGTLFPTTSATTLVDSFTCTPTTPATLNIVLTPGNIYQMEDLEQSTWSSLPQNLATTIMKQGILLSPVTMGITPPATFGYSQVFLLEVQYQDFDTGATVLPYFNAANPQSPFSGPGNAGTAQNTVRQGKVAYQLKAGTAAPTGTQQTPTPDAGWTAIYTITVANGATTITSGNINLYPNAPYLATYGHLPQIPTGVQQCTWSYAVDAGTTNAMSATVSPQPALVPGSLVFIKVANTNTGAVTFNLNGLGAVAVHRANGAALSSGDINAGMVVALIYDGSAWQVMNFEGFTSTTTNNNTFTIDIPYCVDTGTANNIVAPFSPAITSLVAGLTIEVKVAHTNTGATQITVNALAAAPVVDKFGNPLAANAIATGEVILLVYDGTQFQVVNDTSVASSLINGTSYTSHGSYTFTVPDGVYNIFVRLVGAGGAFFNDDVSVDEGNAQNMYDDSGGGAGGYAEGFVAVTPGQTVTVTVGQGGLYSGNTNGGSTSFGAFMSATGGHGNSESSDSGANLQLPLGGVGTGGTANFSGGYGRLFGVGGASAFGSYPACGSGASSSYAQTNGVDGAVFIMW